MPLSKQRIHTPVTASMKSSTRYCLCGRITDGGLGGLASGNNV